MIFCAGGAPGSHFLRFPAKQAARVPMLEKLLNCSFNYHFKPFYKLI
jgi:hypothetical protein